MASRRWHSTPAGRSFLGVVAPLVIAQLALIACTSEETGSPVETPSAAPPTASVANPFESLAAPPSPASAGGLPPIKSIDAAGGQTIRTTHDADWTLVAYHVTWVTGLGGGVGRFDTVTGRPLSSVRIPQGPCMAPDAGFGSVWTATCDEPGIARIDPSGKLVDWFPVDLATHDGESSIGVGEGGVWALADGDTCLACELSRLEPKSGQVNESYPVPEGGASVRAGLGGIWIAYPDRDAMLHVDPDTGEVVAAVATGGYPLFFDIGEGGVWVMNQGDGSVTHIDPSTDAAVATIDVDQQIEGGDLTVGDGSVWLRATDELVARIEPSTDTVVARYGAPQGSGSASAANGQLWISAHDVARIYRIPLA